MAIFSICVTSRRTGAVFAGSALALVLASLLGSAAGGSLTRVIPTDWLQLAASAGFLFLGLRLILRSGQGGAPVPAPADADAAPPGS
ncbi:MAG: TMEM165/GDT1 family protein [Cyanobacteriota bacterium]